ncbi:hypothetical protein BJF78_29125 [Pseudonocardia sp. CNS-139]|nr:hypothetical protein BJF78_29125 [Pseudonocardia sp. CNS-139]
MDTPERFTHQLDEHDAWQREAIRHHGWALQAVLGDDDGPPFVYTVGLSGFGHPELILFATTQATAATVLNDLAELVRAGHALRPGDRVRVRNGEVHLLTFPDSGDWLFVANDLYQQPDGPPVPALLVVPAEELSPTPGDDLPCFFCR